MRVFWKILGTDYFWGIFLGMGFSFLGLYKVVTGKSGWYGDLPIPAWTGWLQLPFGLCCLFWGIRGLWRNWNAPPEPEPIIQPGDLDAQIAEEQTKLDALYLREHGRLPEKPERQDGKN